MLEYHQLSNNYLIENESGYLKFICESNICNIELTLSGSLGELESELINGDNLFKDCRIITSISFQSSQDIYFSSMNSMFQNCESLSSLNINKLLHLKLKTWNLCLVIAEN